MATKNDITGDSIRSKSSNQKAYELGWERIFGKKKAKKFQRRKRNSLLCPYELMYYLFLYSPLLNSTRRASASKISDIALRSVHFFQYYVKSIMKL